MGGNGHDPAARPSPSNGASSPFGKMHTVGLHRPGQRGVGPDQEQHAPPPADRRKLQTDGPGVGCAEGPIHEAGAAGQRARQGQ